MLGDRINGGGLFFSRPKQAQPACKVALNRLALGDGVLAVNDDDLQCRDSTPGPLE